MVVADVGAQKGRRDKYTTEGAGGGLGQDFVMGVIKGRSGGR